MRKNGQIEIMKKEENVLKKKEFGEKERQAAYQEAIAEAEIFLKSKSQTCSRISADGSKTVFKIFVIKKIFDRSKQA